jgi:hypothetical protein
MTEYSRTLIPVPQDFKQISSNDKENMAPYEPEVPQEIQNVLDFHQVSSLLQPLIECNLTYITGRRYF